MRKKSRSMLFGLVGSGLWIIGYGITWTAKHVDSFPILFRSDVQTAAQLLQILGFGAFGMSFVLSGTYLKWAFWLLDSKPNLTGDLANTAFQQEHGKVAASVVRKASDVNALLKASYNSAQQSETRSGYAVLGALLLGFIAILAGVLAVFIGKANSGWVASIAGVIMEFISYGFFKFHGEMAKIKDKYHEQLLISDKLMVALEIADSLPQPERDKQRVKIITKLTN
ncbi:MAG TPA: hypothetical protein VMF06_14700 [Candidatus Limnocylindria bacterium]|nr:hypothetical protein [Candidatus Limnocylindria bacterium]